MSTSVQCLRCHFSLDHQDFIFTLRTDGTGTLHDYDYNDQLEIVHPFDLESFAKQHRTIKLEDYRKIDFTYDYRYNKTDDAFYVPVYNQNAVRDLDLRTLLLKYNNELENPVGNPPSDTELTVRVGTPDEFKKALAVISYLAERAGLDDALYFHTGQTAYSGPSIDQCEDPIVMKLLGQVLDLYRPFGTKYEYVDQNDGRVTAYTPTGIYMASRAKDAEIVMPAARERIDCQNWLEDRLRSHGVDLHIFHTLCAAIDAKHRRTVA
jgi:hypothetical protein